MHFIYFADMIEVKWYLAGVLETWWFFLSHILSHIPFIHDMSYPNIWLEIKMSSTNNKSI